MLLPWLAAHGLAPDRLALDRPIRRNALRRTLRWSEQGEDQEPVAHIQVLHHQRYDDEWPLAFPVDLLTPAAFTDADNFTFFPL